MKEFIVTIWWLYLNFSKNYIIENDKNVMDMSIVVIIGSRQQSRLHKVSIPRTWGCRDRK